LDVSLAYCAGADEAVVTTYFRAIDFENNLAAMAF
jgi:hypothetical protein